MSQIIRPATECDLERINALFNHYVMTSTATFALQPMSDEQRQAWWREHDGRYPVAVAEVDGEFAGWGSLSAYAGRCGYRFTAESSLYVDANYQRRGIGLALGHELLRSAEAAELRSVIAVIEAGQVPSLRLHERLGFSEAGRLRDVGWKFDRRLDVIIMQIVLS